MKILAEAAGHKELKSLLLLRRSDRLASIWLDFGRQGMLEGLAKSARQKRGEGCRADLPVRWGLARRRGEVHLCAVDDCKAGLPGRWGLATRRGEDCEAELPVRVFSAEGRGRYSAGHLVLLAARADSWTCLAGPPGVERRLYELLDRRMLVAGEEGPSLLLSRVTTTGAIREGGATYLKCFPRENRISSCFSRRPALSYFAWDSLGLSCWPILVLGSSN